jgi:hypothetical protein
MDDRLAVADAVAFVVGGVALAISPEWWAAVRGGHLDRAVEFWRAAVIMLSR